MDNAITVSNVSKMYKLYNKPSDRLKDALNLSKKQLYTEHYALKNVSFEISKGECVGIIGVNGAGKSTILKIITGVLTQTCGEVNINGRISALLELGSGFNSEYTGMENIYLNGTMMGFSRQEVDERLDDILKFADIGDFINQPVKTYSSGMFVRLAFAVAINIDPEILIVDEALSVGDVFFQAKCFKKFEEFKQNGKTILFVSHSMGSIAKYCDRVILLNKGQVIRQGNAPDMIDLYKKLLVHQDIDGSDGKDNPEKSPAADMPDVWKDKLTLNPHINSYGNDLAQIIDFALIDESGAITNSIIKGSMFSVKMKVKFNAVLQDPIFAFTIVNLQGTEVSGTNSMIEQTGVRETYDGMIKEITFTQKMMLQGNEYLLWLGCTGYRDGEFTVYHRLYDVCSICVISDKNTVGFFDMDSKVSIK